MPPQVNATLTKITGATAATGGRDDWWTPGDGPAGEAPEKWTGEAGAYYQEKVTRTADGPGYARVLYIESAVARAAGLDTDDVLTFTGPDGVERVERVAIVAIRELAGLSPSLQTARLELELAPA